jgi:type II restriction enzyme
LATEQQNTGDAGERLVAQKCACPRCKRSRTFRQLPTNFKCADLICDFCGFLAQVKACTVDNPASPPDSILGAAWAPQKERMDAAIYFPLYVVTFAKQGRAKAIYYLSADLQEPSIFEPRKALSPTARRAGWQGFNYRLTHVRERLIRLV